MLDRPSFHKKFAETLAGDDAALAGWLEDPAHAARLRVYRNNVVTACADAIVKNYPTVERLVGTEFMRGAAVAFVKAKPPQSPVLSLYGEGFADFLRGFPPAKDLPYLADVARLDRAWTEAFFAPNAPALSPAALAGLGDDGVAALAPGLHPSVGLVTGNWNAWEIWKANRTDGATPKVTLEEGPDSAAVWWSPSGLADRHLTAPQSRFLQAVADGASFGAALDAGDGESDQILAFFSDALAAGLFAKPETLPRTER